MNGMWRSVWSGSKLVPPVLAGVTGGQPDSDLLRLVADPATDFEEPQPQRLKGHPGERRRSTAWAVRTVNGPSGSRVKLRPTMARPPEAGGDRRQETLSAQTIHQLRTPLTIIKGQSQMVARALRRPEPAEPAALLRRLAAIDAMVAQLVGALDMLYDDDLPASSDGAQDGT